jgi:hypothetical protein
VIEAGLRRAGALALVISIVLAGCLTDAPPPTPQPTASASPEATPTVTIYRLDRTVWYGGFVVTFGTATATLDAKGGSVAVEAVIGNPGDDDATMDGPVVLAAGALTVESARESVLPLVPAHDLAKATFVFDVAPEFDVGAAEVRVGREAEHRAIVPLTTASASTVDLRPVAYDLAVEGKAGSLLVQLHRAELRADLPDWRLELDDGVMALTLTYDATFRGTFSGGFPFTAANLGLRLPDGTVLEPRRDGHSQSALVLAPGVPALALQSRFEVPAPGVGPYVLVIRDGATTTDLPLEIPPPVAPPA